MTESNPLQDEIDFIAKVRAVRRVLTAALEGHIDDPAAIAGCGKILRHTANRLQVCRVNARKAA